MSPMGTSTVIAALAFATIDVRAESNGWEPPFKAFDGRAYADGGTLGLGLRDGDGRTLICSVSQDGFESPVPGHTLFLDAWHASQVTARLPLDAAEVEFVKSALRFAATRVYSDEQIVRVILGKERATLVDDNWDARIALHILATISRRDAIACFDPVAEESPPQWWADYDRERHERLARQRREQEVHEAFLAFYPPAAREALESQLTTVTVMNGVAEGRITSDEDLLSRAQVVAGAFDEPTNLAAATCRAFALLEGSWNQLDERDLIAIAAAHSVEGPDFAAAARRLVDEGSATLGVARAVFGIGFDAKLSDQEWTDLVPSLVEQTLKTSHYDHGALVIDSLGRRELSDSDRLLLRIARREIGSSTPPLGDGARARDDPGLPGLAWLKLAEHGKAQFVTEIEKALGGAHRDADRNALEVALALLGQAEHLNVKHFKARSSPIGFGALRAIERSPNSRLVALLFDAGLDHPYAAVANEAILVAQRLTGHRWVPETTRHQSRNFKELAKAWWATNSDTYQPQTPLSR